ncbi:MAG: hypothetical protein HQ519_12000 [Planctomycetes bacterium]|nr:hypothetical protein [Planctomycetota bacterium]
MNIKRHLCALITLTAAAYIAPAASAQTTHQVDLSGLRFSPQDITIQEGDTVLWNWVSGTHDVVSFDGLFDSGAPVAPPFTYSITFDANFLASAPANGNVYDYFCTPHLGFGMVGSVKVVTANPVLTVNNLVAGGTATVTVTNATPQGPVAFAYSRAGGGPTMVPIGNCGLVNASLNFPIELLPQKTADGNGIASLSLNVPAGITGLPVWVQAFDFGSCSLSNGATMVVE